MNELMPFTQMHMLNQSALAHLRGSSAPSEVLRKSYDRFVAFSHECLEIYSVDETFADNIFNHLKKLHKKVLDS